MCRPAPWIFAGTCSLLVLVAGCKQHYTGQAPDARPRDATTDASSLADASDPDAAIPCSTPAECDDQNPCTDDTCPAGFCEHYPVTDGVTCDDGLYCTLDETCQAGLCVAGATMDCSAVADQCSDGWCNETNDECETRPKVDGAACDDGLFCTDGETCTGGICDGGAATDCTGAADACHDGVCNELTDECELQVRADGMTCEDGLFCTVGETCTAGICDGGTTRDCTSISDQCRDGVCDEDLDQCSGAPKPDGTECEDGLFCTLGDTCTDGVCGGPVMDCSSLSDGCNDGLCDEVSEGCVALPKADLTPCSDGVFCTVGETCTGGTCGGGALRDCSASGDQCTDGVCDLLLDQCVGPPKPDGTSCNDGSGCTENDECSGGVCGGAPVVCPGDPCNVGVCNPLDGSCSLQPINEGGSCDDGNGCTQTDTCQAGVCTGSNPVACAASDQCHDAGTCDPGTGTCSDPPKADGTTCNDGSACTQSDTCQAGVCTGADPVTCTASDQCHDQGVCDPGTGTCSNPAKTDGTACDDGLFCNVGETCTAGVCGGGGPLDCSGSGSQCTDGVCDESLDQCVGPPKPDGTACSNQLFCTLDETCTGGICGGGTPRDCSSAGNQCNDGACNETNDVCEPEPKVNGTTCNDSNACTQTDTCQTGVCTGSNPVTCTASDQCHDAGTCNPATGVCSNPPKTNGTACNDSNACTQTDTCQTGICTGANPVTCTASDQCHDAGTCDPGTGICSNPPKADGAACNDGNGCTQTDTCQTGVCTGSNPVTCTASDQCHDAGTCNPSTGVCSNPPKANGTACNDSNACTQTDTCQTGVCTGANPITCTASDQCHDAGVCNPATGTCSNPAKTDGTACNDGLFCNVAETCTAGVCGGGGARDCSGSGSQCTDGVCDESLDQCVGPPKPDGTACSNQLFCTLDETCTGGICGGGTPRDCSSAGNQCNDGACNETNDVCEPEPKVNGTTCNDSNACTQTDTCQTGVCTGSNPVTCTASDQCHDAGTCNPATGVCSNPPKTNGTACNDSNACTQTDTCQTGICTGANPVTCTASDQCHDAGTCNPATGVCTDPPKTNGTSCNDGNGCTQTDTCQTGVCTGSNPVTCTASDQCHDAGTCNPSTGVCSNPPKANGTTCNDGSACTQTDTCQTGVCTGSSPVTCTASDQCHDVGTCNPATGVCSDPPKANGTSCNDGNGCTQTDTCQTGVCTGANPVTCTPSDSCHNAGTCDPGTGLCSNPVKPDGALCEDGLFCTDGTTCTAGVCGGGTPHDCSSLNQPCYDGVCNETTNACESVIKPTGTPCEDGLFCTVNTACRNNGTCGGGGTIDCSAQTDQCNLGVCDEGTDACVKQPANQGNACNDGLFCNSGETCQTGLCTGGSATNCSAQTDQCNLGVCDEGTDACVKQPANQGNPCNDGLFCNSGETCQTGVCTGGSARDCSSQTDQCNLGVCDEGADACVKQPANGGDICNDGLFCNINETCIGGVCGGGGPNPCDDLDPTTMDTCDEVNDQCDHQSSVGIDVNSLVSTTSDLPDPLNVCLTASTQARVVIYTQLTDTSNDPVTGNVVSIEGSPVGTWVEPTAVESPNEPGTYYRTLLAAASTGSTVVTVTANAGAVTLTTQVLVTYAPANAHVTGGTGGCTPIDGNLRVKAVEPVTGVAIPNAYVMVGPAQSLTAYERSFEGLLGGTSVPGANTCITDSNGYCEFYDYGSGLSGPLMVTAGTTGRAYFTIVDAGASDLVLPLMERHPAQDMKRWSNENTNSGNYSAFTALDWIYAGLALPIVDLEFFSQGEISALMEKDRCATLDGDPYLIPENFYIPRYYTFLLGGEVIPRVLWNLSLDANEFEPQNISFPYGRMPTAVVQSGDWIAMLAAYEYQKYGFLLNQAVVDNNGGKNVLLGDDYPNGLTINVTATLPPQTDLLAFAGGDYDGDLGAGRLFYQSHRISRYGPTQLMTLVVPNSDLNEAGSPTGVTRLGSLAARYLDEVGRTPPITLQQRWANTSAVLKDNGAGGAPFGPTGGTWNVTTLLGHTMPTFAEPGAFTWTDAAANGITPDYSMSTLYLETQAYARNACEQASGGTMTTRSSRTTRSKQWIVAKAYNLTNPTCSGLECFQLPTLPAGWPEQGAGSHKRDGFEQRVGSGATCTNTPDCNTGFGETCVDVDQGGLGGLRCAIVTGTAPNTTNTVQRYHWYVRSYRLSAEAAFDFDDYAFDDLVFYLTHQSTNEWTFDN